MRFRDGFSLEELPELRALFSPVFQASETPGFPRRFSSLDDPEHAGPGSLVIAGAGTRLEARAALTAAGVLAEEGITGFPAGLPLIRVRDARAALAALVRALAARIERSAPFPAGENNTVHPTAVVEGVLAGGVTVGPLAHVAAGSFIGRGCRIEAGAVVHPHVTVGARTVIQSGAVIGGAGFGFFGAAASALELMPHEAGVVIGADGFIGANTVIAAGVLHPTEIGDGCKLDSHVQIAHNVRLGKNSRMASQSGIAGSTVIGEGFRMGGAASVAGHLRLGRDVSVAARSGVTKDFGDGATVAGFPARPIAEWRRAQAALARLGKPNDE